jgi:transcriptional regulator with XRE-family HTH domain
MARPDEVDWRRREELRSLLTALRSRLGRGGGKGLRQEDVALLSGLSPRRYAALERGTAENPSLEMIESVASGLRMTPAERSALHVLATGQDPPMPPTAPGDGEWPEVSPDLRELITQLEPHPAAITDEMWTLVVRNHALTTWTGGWFDWVPRRKQNLVLFVFSPEAERVVLDVHAHRRAIIAGLRYQYIRNIGNDRFAELIQMILETGPEARELWERHEVELPRRQTTARVRYSRRRVIDVHTLMTPLSPRTWLILTWLPEGLQPPG